MDSENFEFVAIKKEPEVEFSIILPEDHRQNEDTRIKEEAFTECSVTITRVDANWRKFKQFETFFVCDKGCSIGQKVFRERDGLRNHMESKHGLRVCKECDEDFSSNYLFNKHTKLCMKKIELKGEIERDFKVTHGNKSKSDKSSRVAKSKKNLIRQKSSRNESFHCETCLKSFPKNYLLKHHLKICKHGVYSSTPGQIFACSECCKEFSSQKYLRLHKMNNHEIPSQCDYCGKVIKYKRSLRQHVMSHVKVPCEECGKMLCRLSIYTHYQAIHVAKPKLECDFCGSKVKGKSNMSKHIREVHRNKDSFCLHCKKRFSSEIDYLQHKTVHIGEYRWKCLHCGFIAESNHCLSLHTQSKHALKLFECDGCSSKMKDRRNFIKHFQHMHFRGEFSCKTCHQKFSQRFQLNEHVKSHKTVWKCSQCPLSYKSKNGLNSHMNKKHANKSAVRCKLCFRKFEDKLYLTTHMRKVHADAKLSCLICHKKFATHKEYESHRKIHVGTARYKCPECGLEARTHGLLLRHMKTNHKKI